MPNAPTDPKVNVNKFKPGNARVAKAMSRLRGATDEDKSKAMANLKKVQENTIKRQGVGPKFQAELAKLRSEKKEGNLSADEAAKLARMTGKAKLAPQTNTQATKNKIPDWAKKIEGLPPRGIGDDPDRQFVLWSGAQNSSAK